MDSNSPATLSTGPMLNPMKISSVINPTLGTEDCGISVPRSNKHSDFEYCLKIRQQPVAARSCGFGEKDRRVIDPPTIIQLTIKGPDLTEEEIDMLLHDQYYVMSCLIYDEHGFQDCAFMPEEWQRARRLVGTAISTPFVGKDEKDEKGCFFCFPDLSCRTPGSFRLRFSLTRIDPACAKEVLRFPELAKNDSESFTVYLAKDFPGMRDSSSLVRRLREQGCNIPIRKCSTLMAERSCEVEIDDAG